MPHHWTQGRYLIIDTETTGLVAETDRVVELAAHSVDLATGTVTPVFDQLINPGRPIPPEASAIHHLVDADVASAPPMEQVWADFAPVLAQHDALVAHNAHFDRGFLPPTAEPWICTLRLARHLWPEAPQHTNQVLRYWLGLQVDAPHPHRALDDTRVTAALFQALAPALARTVQLSTPDDVERWAERLIAFPKVPLGKYKDESWTAVPADYLRWALKNWEDPDLLWNVRRALAPTLPSRTPTPTLPLVR